MTKAVVGMESPDNQKILDIVHPLKDSAGALLPTLHKIQQLFGFVPEMAVPLIAKELNISRADVHGVVSFYHYFRSTEPGRYVIQICRAESCQAMGSSALERHVKNALHIDFHETTPDRIFSLEPVYCLGNCACSPAIAIDNEVLGDMDAEKFDQLLKSLQVIPAETGVA